MSILQPTVRVHEEQFKQALEHGCRLYWDGSTPTKRLDQRDGRSGFTRFVNARIEGKLAEEAFRLFLLHEYGIDAEIDYDIYGSYDETDHGDLKHLFGDDGETYPPAVEFDIKKTKPYNSWLAIRSSIYESHDDDAPFILTKLEIADDLVLDEWEDEDDWQSVWSDNRFRSRYTEFVDEHLPLHVDIVGTAYTDEFTDHFDKGDKLYDPNTGRELGGGLRMNNEGIHVDDLVATEERWDLVVDDITDDYPIQYDPLTE